MRNNARRILFVLALASTEVVYAGINEWTSLGLLGVDVQALAIDPLAPTTLYAGTGGEGVFKSIDGGASWSAMNNGLTNTDVFSLAIDPLAPGTLYAGTGSFLNVEGAGVFKSSDGGITWNHISNGIGNRFVSALAIDPVTPSTLYAATAQAAEVVPAFKSTDSGGSWNALNIPLGAWSLAIDPLTPMTLYAGSYGFVSKSTDGGTNWSNATNGITLSPNFIHLAINPQTSTTLYAGTGAGVFQSTDGGGNWSLKFGNSPVTIVAIDPVNPTTLYAAAFGVFKSTNSGAEWSDVSNGLTAGVLSLAIEPQNSNVLYAGTGDGVFKLIQADDTPIAPFLRVPIDLSPGISEILISAVVDHSLTLGSTYNCSFFGTACDDTVLAFNGESGQRENGSDGSTAPGYRKNCEGSHFFLAREINYDSSNPNPALLDYGSCGVGGFTDAASFLNYDGHAGTDFKYGEGTPIIAPAGGVLHIPTFDGINLPSGASPQERHNTFVIVHSNGFETWYLHSKEGSECLAFGSVCAGPDDPDRPPPGASKVVTAGQQLAEVGNTGVAGFHLHFEVRRSADQQIIDPFGCETSVAFADPDACVGFLWDTSIFIDGFESGDTSIWSSTVQEPQNNTAARDATVVSTVRGGRMFITSPDVNSWLNGRP